MIRERIPLVGGIWGRMPLNVQGSLWSFSLFLLVRFCCWSVDNPFRPDFREAASANGNEEDGEHETV